MRNLLLCIAALLVLDAAPAARAQYTFTNVADTSDPSISDFGGPTPSISSAGTLGYFVFLAGGGQGLYTSDGTTTTTIAVTAGPPYAAFGIGSPGSYAPLTAAGAMGFRAVLDGGVSGLFRSDGTTTTTIALESGPTFDFFQPPSMNSAGTMGFMALLDVGDDGLFTSDGVTTKTIALTSGPIFRQLGIRPAINASGTLGFWALLDSESVGGGGGLYTSDGTTITTIALSSGPIYRNFSEPTINAAGKLCFLSDLDTNGRGIFVSDGTTTTTIALNGQIYSDFVSQSPINSSGKVAFNASLHAGGRALLIGDGTTTTQVLHTGDALFGSTVFGFAIGRDGLNDAGQIGFYYQLANGRAGVAIATPVPPPGCQSCPGDMDGDFAIDSNDVQLFLNCVIAAAGGAPTATCECADVVMDSVLDSQDVAQFVSLMLSPPICP